jgi:uncharacterized protein YndB with AHSA1/START domain
MEGTGQRVGDGFILRFERDLDHPIEKVWAALTERDQIAKWLAGTGSDIELRVGGRVYFTGEGSGFKNDAKVIAVEAPHILEYEWKTKEWDAGTLRFELTPTGAGTRLVFVHHQERVDPEVERKIREQYDWPPDMHDPLPRTLAGWHEILDHLGLVLDGEAVGPVSTAEHRHGRWKELHERYIKTVS